MGSANVWSKSLTHPEYRPDIDGLRAVAVLAVIGFPSIHTIIINTRGSLYSNPNGFGITPLTITHIHG